MINVLSQEVQRAAFWRFSNGTIFQYRHRVFKKTSCCSAVYPDKLHGPTIQYFNPFQQFTFVGPVKHEFAGTNIDADAMKVILCDDPDEYIILASEYLDKLRQEVEMENAFIARPSFPSPPVAQRSIRVSRFGLVFDGLMLPCRTIVNAYRSGVPAAFNFLRVYPRWFRDSWRIARWDFWNGPTPKPFIHVPVKPLRISQLEEVSRYEWDSKEGRYRETDAKGKFLPID